MASFHSKNNSATMTESDALAEDSVHPGKSREMQDEGPVAPPKADNHYQSIVDYTYDWEYWENADGTLGYVSPSSERITGYPPQLFMEQPDLLYDLVLPEDRAIWEEHRHSPEAPGTREIQFRIRDRHGQVRWIEHACRTVRDADDEILGYRVSNRDITESMRATEALRRQGETLERMVAERTAELAQANAALREEIAERKQAGLALHKAMAAAETARHEEKERRVEAERRRQIAESLGDVLAVLNSNRPLDEVLDYISVQAGQLLNTRAAGIYSLDGQDETSALSVRALRGLLMTYVVGAEIPIGQEALRRAMVSRQPVAVPDLCDANDELAVDAEQLEAAGPWARVYQALLAVPIVVQNQVYGGLLLYYAESREFSDEEIELASAFGDQIALAIGNARLRDQIEQAAAIAERDRLARELHDAVTQTLFSATLIAEAMPRVWEHDPEKGRRGLAELRELTRGASAEMRAMLVELRPSALTEKPLGELLRHLTEAMTSRSRVPISMDVQVDCILPPDVQIALYRIAQEALNNIAKHAAAKNASVCLDCESGRAALNIGDDGRGFDADDILPDQFGVSIMRERAEGIAALLEIDSQPGSGTQISVIWPAPDNKVGK